MGLCFGKSDHGDSSVPPATLQSSHLKRFNYSDLEKATGNFRAECRVGGGKRRPVFKGWIDGQTLKASQPGTGVAVAVKIANSGSHIDSDEEWLEEVNGLGTISHPNIVGLMGYCLEGENRLLVCEFIPRGSLDNHLFRRPNYSPLSWSIRLKIVLGAAKAIAFLHSLEDVVVFLDFKTSNVLLDSDDNARLSHFRITRLGRMEKYDQYPTRVEESSSYIAPEYERTGAVTTHCDVFSFGVVLLDVLRGQRAVDKRRAAAEYVVKWEKLLNANKRYQAKHLIEESLKVPRTLDDALSMANLALRCVSNHTRSRPSMVEVVQELEALQENGSESKT